MNKELKIVICAGGTGGHIYPGIAIARALLQKDPDSKILFFGSGKKIEKEILSKENFKLVQIKSKGFRRDISLQSLFSFILSAAGYFRSLLELIKFRPGILLSMGGYSSLPTVLAAYTLGIPIILHEQNVFPGLANKIAAKFAKKIALSFEESKKYFSAFRRRRSGKKVETPIRSEPLQSVYVTGNPVREEILKMDKAQAIKSLGLDASKKTVLVVGGSQGALSINNLVIDMVPLLKDEGISIIHICGTKDFERVKSKTQCMDMGSVPYKLFPYLDDMSLVLAASDIVISRAGATILAEIAARGLPSVLIPYPFASEQHQHLNAEVFRQKKAALVPTDSLLFQEGLSDIIKELAHDKSRLKEMSIKSRSLFKDQSAKKIAGIIYDTI